MNFKSLFIKNDLHRISGSAAAEGQKGTSGQLKRTLGAFNITMIGIGAIIGAGIFSITGTAAANYAGPGIVYSFILGGVLSALAGLCYAEMAAMIPGSGSAYTYSYATLGEFIAWIIGWDLVLEYAFGAVTIANAWSGYFVSLFTKTFQIPLSDTLLLFTRGAFDTVTLANGVQTHGIWNIPATMITLLLGVVLYRGTQESARLNNWIVLIKGVIILGFIGMGWAVADPALWAANPTAEGFEKLVPLATQVVKNGHEVMTYGWSGVLTGAGVVFFAYIGFDMISTTAQECKKPSRDIPIGILTSLVICTILYVLMSLVMTGVVPYKELGVSDPIAVGIDHIVRLRDWPPITRTVITFIVKFGAIAGLTSGLLVCMLGQSRILYAMGKDGLLPWFGKVHTRFATPHLSTIATGLFVMAMAGTLPMSLVGELVSIGTLLAFIIVCLGIPVLRWTHPKVERPFKVPFYGLISTLGAATCFWVMTGLPSDTWVRLIIWLAIGFFIYFGYGIKNSKLRRERQS